MGGDRTKQWVVEPYTGAPASRQSPWPNPQRGDGERGIRADAIDYRLLDGSEARYLVGWYGSYNSGDYWSMPKGTPSPDGKLVVFDSNMLAGRPAPRYDLFAVEVPTQ